MDRTEISRKMAEASQMYVVSDTHSAIMHVVDEVIEECAKRAFYYNEWAADSIRELKRG